MFRISIISVFALSSALVASAANVQIQIGGVNGLTSSYITGNGGSIEQATEQNYDNVLFAGATGVSNPNPYPTYNQTTAEAGTIVDGSTTFAMINDGTSSGASNNFWEMAADATNYTMTIPVNVFDVQNVWTLMNTIDATAGNKDIELVFNFTSGALTDSVTVKLTNSGDSSTASGEDRNGVDCSSPPTSCTGVSSPAIGPLLTTTSIGGMTVNTNNAYTSLFSGGNGGNVNLDAQEFVFNGMALTGAFSGNTNTSVLANIEVVENGPTGPSDYALSAITVNAATPEPSTVLLVLAGLGAVGFGRFRRNRA